MTTRSERHLFTERVARVLNYPNTNFIELARVAGLNPARDFRFLNLSKVNMRDCDLSGFDFSGSILVGASLRNARIGKTIFDVDQINLPELLGARDFGSIYNRSLQAYANENLDKRSEQFLQACLANDLESIRAYVALGMDVDQEVHIGGSKRTALVHAATRRRKMYGNIPIIGPEFILRAGADPNYVLEPDGWTALLEAAYQCDPELVSLLIKYGADPNIRNKAGRTPLLGAFEELDFETALILLQSGAHLDPVLKKIGKLDDEQKEFVARLSIAIAN